MAAIVRHVLQKTGQKNLTKYEASRFLSITTLMRKQNAKKAPKTVPGTRIDSMGESIASKGFLRSIKPYAPPSNVINNLQNICQEIKIFFKKEYEFVNLEEKSIFLKKCCIAFEHSVPNSQLHEIKTIDDVIKFYEAPVDTTLPLDDICNKSDLPKNLHIIKNYYRFIPEEDTLFNGQTAFPKSSTLVTGLKYKTKYRGHIAKSSWP